ncbi:MAG: 4-alpha-glucanotransferase, partial [Bacteroidota bacterium]
MHMTRSSGILLHPTSLPGPYATGTLGKEAYRFADMLAQAGQKLWQVLPLYPTGFGDSPYQALSAFAGNPIFISPEILADQGLIELKDAGYPKINPQTRVDFRNAEKFIQPLLLKAFKKFNDNNGTIDQKYFKRFCAKNTYWLDDFALYMALKEHFGLMPWTAWHADIRMRKPAAMAYYKNVLEFRIRYHRFVQFLFSEQWMALKKYANSKSISIIGDNPIFVAHDSADVWAHRELFDLDGKGFPKHVAGFPPDGFSPTGQLWGNPLYNWKKHRETNYKWWIDNIRMSLEQTDYVRIDHFIGFTRYWSIPYGETTAENGKWLKGPGMEFFSALKKHLRPLNLIAEDLGIMTEEAALIMKKMKLPGMKLLHFAFDGNPQNNFHPDNFSAENVVYTGTHDNDTTRGWFAKLSKARKNIVQKESLLSDKNTEYYFANRNK